jgi:nucleoside-diphosphate-sugar epimerase
MTLEAKGINWLTDLRAVGTRIDLRQQELVNLLPTGVTDIVHLAAEIPHQHGRGDDESLLAANSAIDSNVARCIEARDLYGIYFSSCGLYKRDTELPQTEGSPIIPRTPYFHSKAHGESLFLAIDRAAIFRISAPFGRELNEGFILDRFMRAARSGAELTVWGSGAREQDFISTLDIATATAAALETSATGCFNIAAGKPTRMDDLAKMFARHIGGTVVYDQRSDPNESERARIAINRAQGILAWNPSLSIEGWLSGGIS